MSFVTTQPEALTAAAGLLQGISSALVVQNAAAAAPTTGVAPAAADEVSALQAAQFTAYGNLYQQVSAQATAIQQAFVQMLSTSANSYGTTEAANSAATSTSGSGVFSLLGQLTQFGQFGAIPSALDNGGLTGLLQGNMFGAAGSDFFGLVPLASTLGGGGAQAAGAAGLGTGGLGGLSLAGAAGPAGGAAPVLAGLGQASAVGGLSVPPSWAGEAVPVASSTPATLAGAGWTAAAPHGAPVTTVPGGVPSVASAGKASGMAAPRYGVKPKVMPQPMV
jgi:hypothetical protein